MSDDKLRSTREWLVERGAVLRERLEGGTYTLRERCGEEIDSERLRVVPYAAECRRCSPDA